MVADILYFEDFIKDREVKDSLAKKGVLPLGMSIEKVAPVVFDLKKEGHILLSGRGSQEVKKMLKGVLEIVLKNKEQEKEIFLLDTPKMSYLAYGKKVHQYAESIDKGVSLLGKILSIHKEREKSFLAYFKENDGKVNPAEFYSQFATVYVFIADLTVLLGLDSDSVKEMTVLIKGQGQTNVQLIIGGETSAFFKENSELMKAAKLISNVLLMDKMADQMVFSVNNKREFAMTEKLGVGEVYIIKENMAERIKFSSTEELE